MSSVIEQFYIALGLDVSDYEKNQKAVTASLKKFGDASAKQTKLIAEGAKKAANAFSALKVEVLGVIAAYGLGDGIKGFIESNVAGNAALGRMSRNLQMSASDLKAWGYAAQSVGGKAADATNALQSVAKGIADAKLHGSSQLTLAANRYGADISGNDTPEQALLKINRTLYEKAQRYGPQQAMAIASEFGIDSYAMQQLLMQNPAKIQQLIAHYRGKTGNVDTKDAIAFQGALTDIRADVGNLRDDLFAKMAPAMEVFGTKFEAFLDKSTPKLEALVERFSNWLASLDWQKVIDGIQVFVGKVEVVAERLANWLESIDWKKVIEKVGEFFATLQKIVQALGGVKGILIEIAAIKVFGWIASIGMWVVKLRSLTAALAAARAATVAGGAASAAASAAEGTAAGGAAGLASKAIPLATRLSMGAFALWALFHSESTGGKRRADGTYEDEVSSTQLAATAKAAREMQAKHRAQAMSYFMEQGWSRNQAAGIVANLTAESGLRTNAVGDNGQAFGIAQWHKDRQQAFEKFTGRPIAGSSFAEQLAFVNHELQSSEKRAGDWLKRSGNAYSAGALISLLYERTAGGQAEAQRRGQMAQMLSNAYVGAPRGSQTAGAKASTSSSEVHIGTLNVQTKATDAVGVARGMQKALIGNPLIRGSVTALA